MSINSIGRFGGVLKTLPTGVVVEFAAIGRMSE